MQIEELLYKTPEMTEEKLLKTIEKYTHFIKKDFYDRLIEVYNRRTEFSKVIYLPQVIVSEWELIQDKKSYLTKSQREEICGLVSMCLIEMVKGDE